MSRGSSSDPAGASGSYNSLRAVSKKTRLGSGNSTIVNREALFERDDWRCVYCGEQFSSAELTVDHVQPLVRGGDSSGGNVVTACAACNLRKGHRRLSEFLLDEPESLAHFRHLAAHVWPRHLRTLEEAIAAGERRRDAARPRDDDQSR